MILGPKGQDVAALIKSIFLPPRRAACAQVVRDTAWPIRRLPGAHKKKNGWATSHSHQSLLRTLWTAHLPPARARRRSYPPGLRQGPPCHVQEEGQGCFNSMAVVRAETTLARLQYKQATAAPSYYRALMIRGAGRQPSSAGRPGPLVLSILGATGTMPCSPKKMLVGGQMWFVSRDWHGTHQPTIQMIYANIPTTTAATAGTCVHIRPREWAAGC